MTPRLLLTLWRERWGKAADDRPQAAYLLGPQGPWGWELIHAWLWGIPGVSAMAAVMGGALLVMTCSIQFSVVGQTAFSVLLLGAALYLRRHAGTMVAFVLLCLSFTVTIRYLTWRLQSILAPEVDALSFAVGMALWIAELLFGLVIGLGLILTAWPLRRASQPLATPRDQWPTVDLFVRCDHQSPDLIDATVGAALALDWPPQKIQAYFVDVDDRPALRQRAGELGAIYVSSPGNDPARALEDAVRLSQGTLIVIVDGATRLPPTFLLNVVGWFVRDPRLALVHSPHHFLAPPPLPRLLQVLPSRGALFSCAVVRRSSCLELMTDRQDQPRAALLGPRLLRQGNGVAALGRAADGAWVRVDQADSDIALAVRQALASLHGNLRPHLGAAAWVALVTPLACLLGGLQALQGTLALIAAYALPHWLHLYVASSRGQGSRRRTVRQELRDALVALQLLLLTFLAVVCTPASRRVLLRLPALRRAPGRLLRSAANAFLPAWVALSLAAMVVGIYRLSAEGPPNGEFAAAYMLWAAYNMLTLVAAAAVAREAGQIRVYTLHQSRQPLMIRLPQGRTIACRTRNFPSRTLELVRRGSWEFEQGSTLQLFVLQQGCEQGFKAQVLGQRGEMLRVRVMADSMPQYTAIASWMKARHTAGWPEWLPIRDADQLTPIWLQRIAAAVNEMLRTPQRLWIRRWGARRLKVG
jgi:cellulose synthase (UDP-forming)